MQQFNKVPEIPDSSIKELKKGKNLLAFSAGVDSSALFYILLCYKIDFDLAMVDYGIREQSKDEVKRAKELSKKFNKKLFLEKSDKIENNFEHNARVFRYDFFKKIIKGENYTTLITAHQLNDKLEWFLMQFTKGAGLVELLGFDEIRKRDGYTLVRPLVNSSKDELIEFLKSNNLQYFIDKSNFDTKYKRNYFRKNFSTKLLNEYKNGIKRSFEYLQKDKDKLFKISVVKKIEKLYILKDLQDDISNLRAIDRVLKELGYVLSKKQKDEILVTKDLVISDSFAIVFQSNYIFISPYIKTIMPKKFKESCRIKKIPSKTRGYIFQNEISVDFLE